MIYVDGDQRNTDWLRTRTWDLPTDAAAFLEAIGGVEQLDHFMTLPAAEAMPEELRADLAGRKMVETLVSLKFSDDQPRDDHGRWSSDGGSGGDAGTVPPLPGTIPIPEGHVRLFHITWLKNMESIRENGLTRAHARGETYGEPNQVWASAGVRSDQAQMVTEGGIMDSDRIVVEFHADPEKLDVGHFSTPEELEGRRSDVTLYGDVPASDIVAIHEPWHAAYRYLSEYADDVRNGDYDYAAVDNENYARAIEAIKAGKSAKYSEDQERDDHGRWTSGGGESITETDQARAGTVLPATWDSDKGSHELRFPGAWQWGRTDIEFPHEPGTGVPNGRAMADRIIGMKYNEELDVVPGAGAAPSIVVDGYTIQASPDLVTAWDERNLPGIQLWADEHGIPLQEVLDQMGATSQQFFAESRPCVQVDSENLAAILEDGLKNQFETRDSNGTYKPGLRKDAESELFGLPATGVPGADRPIYGYVGDLDGSDGSVGQYGDVSIVLNADVADRTTVTNQDSLDRTAIPEPMNETTWRQTSYGPGGFSGYNGMNLRPSVAGHYVEQAGYDDQINATDMAGAYTHQLGDIVPETVLDWTDGRVANPPNASGGYVEAQIFGRVTREDISEVVFRGDPQPQLEAKLDELGIPWSNETNSSRDWSPSETRATPDEYQPDILSP